MSSSAAVLNVAAYRFVELDELPALRERLLAGASAEGLRGTILLAREGINLFLAGAAARVRGFLLRLEDDARLAGLDVKESWSKSQPFARLRVRIKREIVAMGRSEVNPLRRPAARISARELRRWLDQGRDFILLDTRNRFEFEAG